MIRVTTEQNKINQVSQHDKIYLFLRCIYTQDDKLRK